MSNSTGPTMRVGIVGLGGAARQMLPSLVSHPRVLITAAADPRAEARRAFELEYGGRAFADPAEMCAQGGVDVVYIATPHQMHRDHATIAAEAGKHIILEKPMALTLADCQAIITTADTHEVHLVVGHTHGFDAGVRKMREMILAGAIGPVSMINSWNYGNFLYRPRRPEELCTDLGGGVVYNQAPHQVDVVRLLGGGMVRSVRASATILDPGRPTEGAYLAFLQFEDGAAASLVYSGYDYFDTDEFHGWIGELGEPRGFVQHGAARRALRQLGNAGGEAGVKAAGGLGGGRKLPELARADWSQPHFGVTLVSGPGGDLRQSPRGVIHYGPDGAQDVTLNAPRSFPEKGGVIDEMYAAFVGGRASVFDGRWGLATMEVCHAILQSSREQREISLSHQIYAQC